MSLFDNSFLPIKKQIDQYAKKAMDFFEKTENKTAYKSVSSLLLGLDNLRYNITIVGSFNRGKSTLLNTLMERADDNISPIDRKACTSAIVKYLDKNLKDNPSIPKEVARVLFKDNKEILVPFSDIREYVVEANNPNNNKNVKIVEVYGDFPQWSKAVTIIDSPGQNTTYEHHDTLLTEHLPNTDAIIFLIAGDLPLDAGDLKLLKELNQQQKSKIFFVLTKIDEFDDCPDDLDMVLEYTKKNIEEVIPNAYNKQIYPVAAERVFEAFKDNKPKEIIEKLKQENGIKKLEDDLEKFIMRESDISKTFISKCRNIITFIETKLKEFYSINKQLLEQKEFDYEKFKIEKHNFENQNKELKAKLEETVKTFERKCNKVVSNFEYKAKNKLSKVNDEIVSVIKSASFVDSVYKSFNLQKDAEKIFYKHYEDDLNHLSVELNSIQTEFTDEFDNQIRIYKERLSCGLDKDSANSGKKVIALYGSAIAGGGTASALAIGQAATSLTALAAANAVKDGALVSFWYWLTGGTSATTAAAIAAKSTAIAAGLTAAVTIGASLGVAYVAQKLCHNVLKNKQENRIPELTEEYLETMLDNIKNALDEYINSFVDDYMQYINDMIEQNNKEINRIEKVLSCEDFAIRDSLKLQIEEAKTLLTYSSNIVAMLPTA